MSTSDITIHEGSKSLGSTASSTSRFGSKSHNMFFSRNVAQPKNLKFITGVGNTQICAVKDDDFQAPTSAKSSFSIGSSIISDPRFSFGQYGDNLLKSYSNMLIPKRKKERLLPPLSFWSSSGIIVDDTTKWRDELNHLASSVGLMTTEEINTATDRLQKDRPNIPNSPMKQKISHFENKNKTPKTSEYSRKTGRLNEATPKTGFKFSRGGSKMPSYVFCVENGEREMWMIQVLFQLLQTDSFQDVQSWLVSAGNQEKEFARDLITKALQGLQESGRIETESNSYNNFNDISKNNTKEVQVDLDKLQDTIKKMEFKQTQPRQAALESASYPNLNTIVEQSESRQLESRQPPNSPKSPRRMNAVEPIKYVSEKSASVKPSSAKSAQNLNVATDEANPLQRILTASLKYEPITQNPKTAAVFNDRKNSFMSTQSSKKERPLTADVFKTGNDATADKRLSNKIIKELMSFVEIERQNKPSSKSSAIETMAERKPLFTPKVPNISSATQIKGPTAIANSAYLKPPTGSSITNAKPSTSASIMNLQPPTVATAPIFKPITAISSASYLKPPTVSSVTNVRPKSGSSHASHATKIKLTKIPERDAQILTIED